MISPLNILETMIWRARSTGAQSTPVLHPRSLSLSPASASLGWWGWKIGKHTCICNTSHEQLLLHTCNTVHGSWLPSKRWLFMYELNGSIWGALTHRLCKKHNCLTAILHHKCSTEIILILLTPSCQASHCSGSPSSIVYGGHSNQIKLAKRSKKRALNSGTLIRSLGPPHCVPSPPVGIPFTWPPQPVFDASNYDRQVQWSILPLKYY